MHVPDACTSSAYDCRRYPTWHSTPACWPTSACRLIWALVHSTTRSNQQRGLELAQAALDNDQRSQDQDRELRYYQSGGHALLLAAAQASMLLSN